MDILSEDASLSILFFHLFLIGVNFNPIELRKAKIVCNFGLSECNRVKGQNLFYRSKFYPLIRVDTFLDVFCSPRKAIGKSCKLFPFARISEIH